MSCAVLRCTHQSRKGREGTHVQCRNNEGNKKTGLKNKKGDTCSLLKWYVAYAATKSWFWSGRVCLHFVTSFLAIPVGTCRGRSSTGQIRIQDCEQAAACFYAETMSGETASCKSKDFHILVVLQLLCSVWLWNDASALCQNGKSPD